MLDQLTKFVDSLKSNPRVPSYGEAETKQAIIIPLLHILGWDTYNTDEVAPEFSVGNRRVDYSLRLNASNEVFIEVKKTAEDLDKDNYQEQLLDYSFRLGIDLAILTNGITWCFYLPTRKGDWKTRKFYTVDMIQQATKDIASKLIDLISKNSVQSGKAVQHAEFIYEGRLRTQRIEETLSQAWNKIIFEPDALLIDLISETTERICGFKPACEEVKVFLKNYQDRLLVSRAISEETGRQVQPRAKVSAARRDGKISAEVPLNRRITQNDLIPYIVDILRKHGGRAQKADVDREIYQALRETFEQPWFQDSVARGIPRWKHFIAWAKERAKGDGLIKSPADSGRGYWELTSKAMQ